MIDSDTPITRTILTDMSDEDQDAMIHAIRERRLKPIRDYEEGERLKAVIHEQYLKEKLEKQLDMFAKELLRANKAMDALDKRARNIRSIKLEM